MTREDTWLTGRGRWGTGAVAVALGQAAWLYQTVKGDNTLNLAQIRPILLLGSIGWLAASAMGIAGIRSLDRIAKIIAGTGIVASLAGLGVTVWKMLTWWQA